MRLNLISVPNADKAAIESFAAANGLQVKEMENFKNRFILDFHFLLLPELLKAVPELARRMWLFDSTEEVGDAWTSERTNTNILIGFGIDCGEFEMWFEREVDHNTFETWLVNADLVETKHGGLVREVIYGRAWDGSDDCSLFPYSVGEWLEEYQNDERILTKLFHFFVLKFHKEITEIIEENRQPDSAHSKLL